MTEPTCVPCPGDRYALEPAVRLRPVPELGVCLAYTPARPALHRLNPASWLIASLCDGRTDVALQAAYAEALGQAGQPPDEAALRAGLAQLLALGVVRRVSAAPPASWNPTHPEPSPPDPDPPDPNPPELNPPGPGRSEPDATKGDAA
jgi:hypothetical protein